MFCHICGKELDSHPKFCHHCGTAIPLIEKHIISQETVNEDLNVSTTNSQEKTTTKKVETPKVRILWDNICQHKYIAFSILAIILIVILNFTIEEKDVKNIPSTTMEETTISSHEVEDERWDAESGTYANFKYGIAFNLTRGVSWERVSGTAKHTVVKFLQPDSGLTMYANIYPLGAGVPSDNIWDIYSEFIKIYKEGAMPYISNNNGIEVNNFTHRKADICGKNAIKIEHNFIIDDERYDGEIFTTVEYIFLYKGSMVSVGATCINEWVDNFLEDNFTLEDFLRSFHLTPTNNNNINN